MRDTDEQLDNLLEQHGRWVHWGVAHDSGVAAMAVTERSGIAWFSTGAASACAARLAVLADPHIQVCRIGLTTEHPDGERFTRDVAAWLGRPIKVISSKEFRDTYEVWTRRRYLVGPDGAPCTAELKKKVRRAYQKMDERQVFGFTAEEEKRADRFREQNPEVDLWCPLIDAGMGKADCHAMVKAAGIKRHAMYDLGYKNANCIGCVKGGIGYWNKIREDFPEQFNRMAELERDIGYAILKDRRGGNKIPLYLDELEPGRGRYDAEPDWECGIACPTEPT